MKFVFERGKLSTWYMINNQLFFLLFPFSFNDDNDGYDQIGLFECFTTYFFFLLSRLHMHISKVVLHVLMFLMYFMSQIR